MNNLGTTIRQLVSTFGQHEVWAVYQVEMTPDLLHVVSKSLDTVEYYTADENNEPITVVMDVTEAADLLGNLRAVLEGTR